MPIRVGTKGKWQIIQPTTTWQTMATQLKRDSSKSRRICTS